MKDAREFKESQISKQEQAVLAAIESAERTPNPVIEIPFLIYPEMETMLSKKGWKVLGTCSCTHEGKVLWYTHICPKGVENQNAEPESYMSGFYVPGNL